MSPTWEAIACTASSTARGAGGAVVQALDPGTDDEVVYQATAVRHGGIAVRSQAGTQHLTLPALSIPQ